jgi:hypothetical protein
MLLSLHRRLGHRGIDQPFGRVSHSFLALSLLFCGLIQGPPFTAFLAGGYFLGLIVGILHGSEDMRDCFFSSRLKRSL